MNFMKLMTMLVICLISTVNAHAGRMPVEVSHNFDVKPPCGGGEQNC